MRIVAFLTIAGFFFFSCKSKKELGSINYNECKAVGADLTHLSEVHDSLKNVMYKIKGSTDITLGDKGLTVDFQLRIKLDSIIWISLSKSGFPVAKMAFTQDSIKAVDLFNKKYLRSSYDSLNHAFGLGIDYAFLQNALLAKAFKFDSIHQWKSNEHLVQSSLPKSVLQRQLVNDTVPQKREKGKAQWINCHNLSLKQQFYTYPERAIQVWVNYQHIDSTSILQLPKTTEIDAREKGSKKLFCTLEYKRVKTAKKYKTILNIPENYEPMD